MQEVAVIFVDGETEVSMTSHWERVIESPMNISVFRSHTLALVPGPETQGGAGP